MLGVVRAALEATTDSSFGGSASHVLGATPHSPSLLARSTFRPNVAQDFNNIRQRLIPVSSPTNVPRSRLAHKLGRCHVELVLQRAVGAWRDATRRASVAKCAGLLELQAENVAYIAREATLGGPQLAALLDSRSSDDAQTHARDVCPLDTGRAEGVRQAFAAPSYQVQVETSSRTPREPLQQLSARAKDQTFKVASAFVPTGEQAVDIRTTMNNLTIASQRDRTRLAQSIVLARQESLDSMALLSVGLAVFVAWRCMTRAAHMRKSLHGALLTGRRSVLILKTMFHWRCWALGRFAAREAERLIESIMDSSQSGNFATDGSGGQFLSWFSTLFLQAMFASWRLLIMDAQRLQLMEIGCHLQEHAHRAEARALHCAAAATFRTRSCGNQHVCYIALVCWRDEICAARDARALASLMEAVGSRMHRAVNFFATSRESTEIHALLLAWRQVTFVMREQCARVFTCSTICDLCARNDVGTLEVTLLLWRESMLRCRSDQFQQSWRAHARHGALHAGIFCSASHDFAHLHEALIAWRGHTRAGRAKRMTTQLWEVVRELQHRRQQRAISTARRFVANSISSMAELGFHLWRMCAVVALSAVVAQHAQALEPSRRRSARNAALSLSTWRLKACLLEAFISWRKSLFAARAATTQGGIWRHDRNRARLILGEDFQGSAVFGREDEKLYQSRASAGEAPQAQRRLREIALHVAAVLLQTNSIHCIGVTFAAWAHSARLHRGSGRTALVKQSTRRRVREVVAAVLVKKDLSVLSEALVSWHMALCAVQLERFTTKLSEMLDLTVAQKQDFVLAVAACRASAASEVLLQASFFAWHADSLRQTTQALATSHTHRVKRARNQAMSAFNSRFKNMKSRMCFHAWRGEAEDTRRCQEARQRDQFVRDRLQTCASIVTDVFAANTDIAPLYVIVAAWHRHAVACKARTQRERTAEELLSFMQVVRYVAFEALLKWRHEVLNSRREHTNSLLVAKVRLNTQKRVSKTMDKVEVFSAFDAFVEWRSQTWIARVQHFENQCRTAMQQQERLGTSVHRATGRSINAQNTALMYIIVFAWWQIVHNEQTYKAQRGKLRIHRSSIAVSINSMLQKLLDSFVSEVLKEWRLQVSMAHAEIHRGCLLEFMSKARGDKKHAAAHMSAKFCDVRKMFELRMAFEAWRLAVGINQAHIASKSMWTCVGQSLEYVNHVLVTIQKGSEMQVAFKEWREVADVTRRHNYVQQLEQSFRLRNNAIAAGAICSLLRKGTASLLSCTLAAWRRDVDVARTIASLEESEHSLQSYRRLHAIHVGNEVLRLTRHDFAPLLILLFAWKQAFNIERDSRKFELNSARCDDVLEVRLQSRIREHTRKIVEEFLQLNRNASVLVHIMLLGWTQLLQVQRRDKKHAQALLILRQRSMKNTSLIVARFHDLGTIDAIKAWKHHVSIIQSGRSSRQLFEKVVQLRMKQHISVNRVLERLIQVRETSDIGKLFSSWRLLSTSDRFERLLSRGRLQMLRCASISFSEMCHLALLRPVLTSWEKQARATKTDSFLEASRDRTQESFRRRVQFYRNCLHTWLHRELDRSMRKSMSVIFFAWCHHVSKSVKVKEVLRRRHGVCTNSVRRVWGAWRLAPAFLLQHILLSWKEDSAHTRWQTHHENTNNYRTRLMGAASSFTFRIAKSRDIFVKQCFLIVWQRRVINSQRLADMKTLQQLTRINLRDRHIALRVSDLLEADQCRVLVQHSFFVWCVCVMNRNVRRDCQHVASVAATRPAAMHAEVRVKVVFLALRLFHAINRVKFAEQSSEQDRQALILAQNTLAKHFVDWRYVWMLCTFLSWRVSTAEIMQQGAENHLSWTRQRWQGVAFAAVCRHGAFRKELCLHAALVRWSFYVQLRRSSPSTPAMMPVNFATKSKATCVLSGIAFLEWCLATLQRKRIGQSAFAPRSSKIIAKGVELHKAAGFHRLCEDVIKAWRRVSTQIRYEHEVRLLEDERGALLRELSVLRGGRDRCRRNTLEILGKSKTAASIARTLLDAEASSALVLCDGLYQPASPLR